MNTCLCGIPVEQEGALCERCSALQILGLDSDASHRQIESTYRLLVKVWHPDRFQTDPKLKEAAEEKLKSINAAHAYLHSVGPTRARRRAAKKPPAQDVAVRPAAKPRSGVFDTVLASGILLRGLVLLAGLAVPLLLVIGLDSWLSSNPATAAFYARYRSQVLFALHVNTDAAKQRVEEKVHALTPEHIASAPAQSQPDPAVTSPADAQPAISVPVPHVPMPYVTVGLTPDEVASVMGPPVSTTADVLRYHNAVFYLHKGVVVGWKVDPSLIPLRVKLWPARGTDPHVVNFTIGSTKDNVIAVQGTPTLLSENKLGYGNSEVFLESGRVIGWNDNHASERLHVASR